MAYSDFTLSKLKKEFGLEQDKVQLFKPIPKLKPSKHLMVDISDGLEMPKNTEKARSENLVSPILREIYRRNKKKMTLFPGYGLQVDVEKGLNGNCDCIIAGRGNIVELTNPIICLVEAKNGVIEDGYGQCGAEMYAARIYNEELGTPIPEVFGVITNGDDWQFVMLKDNLLVFDEKTISVARLPQILGILQFIVDKTTPSVSM
jgi:hypothetical protein